MMNRAQKASAAQTAPAARIAPVRQVGSAARAVAVILLLAFTAVSCAREALPLVPDDYTSWKSPTEEVLNYPIPGHMEHYRRIFINRTGEGVTVESRGGRSYHDYPKGTIIVKEIFPSLEASADEKPMALTVMIKDPEHPQARGGWVWVRKVVETAEETVIDYELCFDCHANANESHPYGDGNPEGEFRDFVYFPYTEK